MREHGGQRDALQQVEPTEPAQDPDARRSATIAALASSRSASSDPSPTKRTTYWAMIRRYRPTEIT